MLKPVDIVREPCRRFIGLGGSVVLSSPFFNFDGLCVKARQDGVDPCTRLPGGFG